MHVEEQKALLQERRRAYSDKAVIAARIKAYLRSAAVTDEAVLEYLSRRIVDEALSSSVPARTAEEREELRAVRGASLVLQEWLDAQLGESTLQPDAARGLLAWYLRTRRDSEGIGLMMRDVPPPILGAALRASAADIVPQTQPGRMPKQVLGELPPVLRVSFWRRSWRSTQEILLQAFRILWGQ